eukprot:PLAT14647.2.p1 GENE.PLAT14647.2~~PLAT14647.2.p1  ORF type:complete len:518 (-),score=231.78 PLAT14647.2:147-1676(-)
MTKRTIALACVAAVALLAAAGRADYDWTPVDNAITNGIAEGAFAGAVGMVVSAEGRLYHKAFGNFTYGEHVPPVTGHNTAVLPNTTYDMASCTKVIATTSAVALQYQWGALPLETRVSDESLLGKDFAANGKADITVLNALLHNTGFPPDPTPEDYWNTTFGCAATPLPPKLSFNCSQKIYNAFLAQKLDRPIGVKYVYSDLSFITLMYVVGRVAQREGYVTSSQLLPSCANAKDVGLIYQCHYEAFVRVHVFDNLGMTHSGFLPAKSEWAAIAPTAVPRAEGLGFSPLQGRVNDGNAYALGGISGHAGLFTNALDMEILGNALLYGIQADKFLNHTTVKLFSTEYNHTQSSRALGWNTNDPTVFDEGWNQTCGHLSNKTYNHIGYTGTQICIDPVNNIFTIFLTNRVWPTDKNEKIERVRQLYNDAVVDVLGLPYTPTPFELEQQRLAEEEEKQRRKASSNLRSSYRQQQAEEEQLTEDVADEAEEQGLSFIGQLTSLFARFAQQLLA